MTFEEILARFSAARTSSSGTMAKCPSHEDTTASLSIGIGEDGRILLHCHAGCEVPDIVAAAGLKMDDLRAQRRNGHAGSRSSIVAVYDYKTASDELLYQVVRLAPKGFRQRRPDGTGGWVWKLTGVERILYQTQRLDQQPVVYVVEGEKDVDMLWALQFPATTNVGGAGKWRESYAQQLQALGAKRIVILPDNDDTGRAHATIIATSCHAAGLEVQIIALPDLPDHGDVSDWFDSGHTREDLLALVNTTALYTPASEADTSSPAASDMKALLKAALGQKESMATQLVRLVTGSDAELWHDQASQQPYITVTIDDHREHYRLNTRAARDWLARLGHQKLGRTPGGTAVSDATTVLSGIARYDGTAYPVAVRLASFEDSLVLDLGDESWRVVVIAPAGWHISETPPFRFRRSRGMLALPVPVTGGTLTPFRELLHIESDQTWTQLVGWLVGAFAPRGPYPVQMILGEQGSGKSTVGRFERGLIDPHMTMLRGPVREERDLMIAASHSHVVAFDNLSRIPDWLSDGLCRIATGGGFATRALYTDDDEHMIDVTKPIMLTAISAVISRGDLLDRASVVSLPTIPEAGRKSERELIAEYEALRPSLVGALLDAAVVALCERPHVDVENVPRMADHCLWVTAAEPALGWETGTYIQAYSAQQQDAVEVQLDGDPVVMALRKVLSLATDNTWEGTPTELHETLGRHAPDDLKRQKESGWPRSPKGLSMRLDRLAPDLRRTGIDVSRYHNGRERVVSVRTVRFVSTPENIGPTANELTNESPATNESSSPDTNESLPPDFDSLGHSLANLPSILGPNNASNECNESAQLLLTVQEDAGDPRQEEPEADDVTGDDEQDKPTTDETAEAIAQRQRIANLYKRKPDRDRPPKDANAIDDDQFDQF